MKFDTGPKGTLVYTHLYEPAWGEMDALGHINNSRYFVWCEQSRIDWLDSMGESGFLSGKSPTGPVVINAACTFHRQVSYPAKLEIRVFAGDAGRSSFVTRYQIIGADTGVIHCTGAAKIVWVDYEEEKAMPLPERIRAAVGD